MMHETHIAIVIIIAIKLAKHNPWPDSVLIYLIHQPYKILHHNHLHFVGVETDPKRDFPHMYPSGEGTREGRHSYITRRLLSFVTKLIIL